MGRLGLPGFWIAFSGTYLIAVTENFGFLAPVLAKQSPAVLARSPSTGLWHRSRGGCADCLPVLTRGTNVSILVGWRVAPAAYPGLEHSADFFLRQTLSRWQDQVAGRLSDGVWHGRLSVQEAPDERA